MFYSIICFMFSLVASPVPSTWHWPMSRNQNCKPKTVQRSIETDNLHLNRKLDDEGLRWMSLERLLYITSKGAYNDRSIYIYMFCGELQTLWVSCLARRISHHRNDPFQRRPKRNHHTARAIRVVSNSYVSKAILLSKEYCNSMFCGVS